MAQVTVWNEYRTERRVEEAEEIYPHGIHEVIAEFLEERGHSVQTATLDEPEHGLTEEVLDETDVLTWWGHEAHDEVEDEIVERVKEYVRDGMGLIVMHSAHMSKIFTELLGTTGSLKWRQADETERLWAIEPSHPITEGIDEYIELPRTEMYGERFDIPEPDKLVFLSWFEGGNVFRSGCCYSRGKGNIFYFRPGHETEPIYRNPEIQQVIDNAVEWAAPVDGPEIDLWEAPEPLEEIEGYDPEQ